MNINSVVKIDNINYLRQRRLTIILTACFSVIMFGLTFISVLGAFISKSAHPAIGLEVVFCVIFLGLYILARRGHHFVSAHLLLLILISLYFYLILKYGVSLTTAELLAAATITMAGVMLQARLTLFYCVILAIAVTCISFLQASGNLHPDLTWRLNAPLGSDAIGMAMLFVFVGIVTWLSAKEIDELLFISQESENALKKEKRLLERRVRHRTKALEMAHLERTLQNQRFIQCGQLYANLIHDLLNHLTTINLQLDRIVSPQNTDALNKVQRSLHHIERYIVGARKHLRGQSRPVLFSLNRALQDAVNLAKHVAKQKNVSIVINVSKHPTYIKGDSTRFKQVIINLIFNAIQSYDLTAIEKPVVVSVKLKSQIIITITDQGTGMSRKDIISAFEPFKSNRADGSTGLGIGLFLAREYIEHEMGGSLTLSSRTSVTSGTVATIKLPLQK